MFYFILPRKLTAELDQEGQNFVEHSERVVDHPHQVYPEADELGDDDDIYRRAPVEDHEAGVEEEGVERQHEGVRPHLPFFEADHDPEEGVELDNHQEEHGVLEEDEAGQQEVGLAEVPLLDYLRSYELLKGYWLFFLAFLAALFVPDLDVERSPS